MSVRMKKNRLRLISGIMAFIMSFYGVLPVGAAELEFAFASMNTEIQTADGEHTLERI